MSILAIIPARFASTRFPGKPLIDLGGKTMIERVYQQVLACPQVDKVLVATDDKRIAAEVRRFGGEVVMTSPDCPSGTDRCAEVLSKITFKPSWVLNVQGDEPFLAPQQIGELIGCLRESDAGIGTLARPLRDPEAIQNPNVVKVVFDARNKAMYFSRNPIPYVRQAAPPQWPDHAQFFQHIGLYGFKADVLPVLSALPPGSLEMAESLEQLRWLQAGFSVQVGLSQYESLGIDSPDDLPKAMQWLKNEAGNSMPDS